MKFPEGVVDIAGSLRCKPDVVQEVLTILQEEHIVEQSKDGVFTAIMKPEIYQRGFKCDYCNHINYHNGCKAHGYTCKGCNKMIYDRYLRGSKIRFIFWGSSSFDQMCFLVHSYDMTEQKLYVYAKPQKYPFCGKDFVQKQLNRMEENKNTFEEVVKDGKKLFSFYKPLGWGADAAINTIEITPPPSKKVKNADGKVDWIVQHPVHYKEVWFYKGTELTSEPKNTFLCVYVDSGVMKNKKMAHNLLGKIGMTGNMAYYSGGWGEFGEVQFERLKNYISVFTDLDVQAFGEFLKDCRTSGPGFICDFAEFIQGQTGIKQKVEVSPGIFNVLVPVIGVLSGKFPSARDAMLMEMALSNPAVCEEVSGFLTQLEAKNENRT